MVRDVLEAQRRRVVELRNEGAISDDVMHRSSASWTWRTSGSRSELGAQVAEHGQDPTVLLARRLEPELRKDAGHVPLNPAL